MSYFYIDDNCLMTNDNDWVAEVCNDGLEVYDSDMLVEWFENDYPEEAALCDTINIYEYAREKFIEVINERMKQ